MGSLVVLEEQVY